MIPYPLQQTHTLIAIMQVSALPLKSTPRNSLSKSSVADPDPGSGAFLTSGSGMGKKIRNPDPRSGSWMNNPDHIFESLETIFWVKIPVLKLFFDADQGSGMEKIRIRDPG